MEREQQLEAWVQQITALDEAAQKAAANHLDDLTKPPGSLGKLEELTIRLAGITGKKKPAFSRKAVIVMASDHGVVEEGVSSFPAEVTQQMVHNFLAGGAAVNVLARHAGAEVICVDIGVNGEPDHPDLVSRSVRKGTANMAKGPAMSREEALQAILTGIDVVQESVKKGTQLFVTGEMGIGNTTPSAAVTSVLTGVSVQEATGKGTGLDQAGVQHKANVIARAIELNQPDPNDPIDVLAKVGGLDIAGLAGVIIGSAALKCPVVIDGYISTAAALVASRIAPACRNYMIASHTSEERGHVALLQTLDLSPMLQVGMRLGEGTGGVLCLHLIEAAGRIMDEMATFSSAGISSNHEMSEAEL
ncbi:nicotinate-nucleotide--dimethylbenzimidazole phosphoribosyltransferase [Paenibacillus gallinarum]|uniref:Nicotinate-nucleotide--dimethylbenzimidazole phosphoribosyltransferase n=1 Tax=Paenibacillus gallinarum TaxID=2762232 RepID=A0ABR8SSY2_9BACL|nr:nicotinate-nucleotide--dimethylbenzimidazole phosphoribosyltransferase [Paenibacillus gallinarum]MBD7966608.1 nicotinate-nucleotide--dimethylbenzimidazole phosphoribosyltransferase [Paenibacillus gallinarum]